MKRILSLLMIMVLVLGALAACGPDEEPAQDNNATGETTTDNAGTDETATTDDGMPEKPEKLVVWEDTKKGVALEPAIKAFEEEFGIKVEYRELGMAEEIRNQLRLDGPAGTGPDIVTLPHDQIGQVVVEGLIQEVKSGQEVLDTFTESSLSAQTYNGVLYGLPKATETPILIYNKALVDGEPVATFEELYNFSKEFTNGTDKFGFLALWDNYYFGHAILGGYGAYVFKNNDGTLDPKDVGLANEGAVQGAEYIQKWYAEGLFPNGIIGENGGSTKEGLMNEGKVAYTMDGPWAFQGLKDAGIDYGAAPMPTLPNGEHPTTFMGVKGWHLTSFTKHPEWSTKLLEYITNAENAKIRFELTGEIPPVKALIDDPIIAENEGAAAVAVQSQYAIPMPNIPQMSEVWGPMATALQLVALQDSEPKAAVEEAVATINANIEANHPSN
ncbi:extracellular solute-binding protein [Bacillus sp. HMF5848]|uniref:extracellular solute-binding protein n=1 Tax=Bacillus sp. HMF5848 TaxID=2495421 RepID=UPI000F79B3C6|nr:extracellular solute-binding protein [Bacillus sp. HMF5848]RSK26396.1 extracellular solute-binding protein [Bacillus sp. HMF5848]